MCLSHRRVWMVCKYGENHEGISTQRPINEQLHDVQEDIGNQWQPPNRD